MTSMRCLLATVLAIICAFVIPETQARGTFEQVRTFEEVQSLFIKCVAIVWWVGYVGLAALHQFIMLFI